MSLKSKLRIRLLKKSDCYLLLTWANEKSTRKCSINQSLITKRQHKIWFASIFKNRWINPVLICVKSKKTRIGIVRISKIANQKRKWEIHFTISPAYRGKGFAKPMLEKSLKWFRKKVPNQFIHARVKALNKRSLKILSSLGFKKIQSSKTDPDLIVLRLPARLS